MSDAPAKPAYDSAYDEALKAEAHLMAARAMIDLALAALKDSK